MSTAKLVFTVSFNGIPVSSFYQLTKAYDHSKEVLRMWKSPLLGEMPSYNSVAKKLKSGNRWLKDHEFDTISITSNILS